MEGREHMDRTEYRAEYMRIATKIKRNWEADEQLKGGMRRPDGIVMPTSEEWGELGRLSKERDRLCAERGYLVQHWSAMPSPAPDETEQM